MDHETRESNDTPSPEDCVSAEIVWPLVVHETPLGFHAGDEKIVSNVLDVNVPEEIELKPPLTLSTHMAPLDPVSIDLHVIG